MKCARPGCNNEINENTKDIEYSQDLCEYYCSPDCATTVYFDKMGSRPVDWNEILEEDKKRQEDKAIQKIFETKGYRENKI